MRISLQSEAENAAWISAGDFQLLNGASWALPQSPCTPYLGLHLLNDPQDCLTTTTGIAWITVVEQKNHMTSYLTMEILVPTIVVSRGLPVARSNSAFSSGLRNAVDYRILSFSRTDYYSTW